MEDAGGHLSIYYFLAHVHCVCLFVSICVCFVWLSSHLFLVFFFFFLNAQPLRFMSRNVYILGASNVHLH